VPSILPIVEPPRPRALAKSILAASLAASLVACRESPSQPTPELRHNVVLIVVDTLRADHLGHYGYPRATSPRFDEWATANVSFTQARSQASCTFPSVNSIFTSRYPHYFLNQPEARIGIPDAFPTLAEHLQRAGWATYAVSASPIVRRTPSQFNPAGGFDRGFEVFDEQCIWEKGECVRKTGLRLLRDHDRERPFFLYLHFMDPHGPFNPPPEHERQFATGRTGIEAVDKGQIEAVSALHYAGTPLPGWDRERHLQHLIDLYDDEILYFDGQLQRLLKTLDREGFLEETLVVLTADHGEAFFEHDHVKHCRTVYDPEVRVPMVFAGPGLAPRHRLNAPVMNLDITPTILDYLGLADDVAMGAATARQDAGENPPPAPDETSRGRLQLDGNSLLPLLRGERRGPHAFTVSAMGSWRGLTDGRHKLVLELGTATRAPQLFELTADPGEQADIASQAPAVTRRLRGQLRRWHLAMEGGDEAKSAAAGKATQDQLRSLGYIQ
jgi:arylsulfatase A-like enzyme